MGAYSVARQYMPAEAAHGEVTRERAGGSVPCAGLTAAVPFRVNVSVMQFRYISACQLLRDAVLKQLKWH